MKKYNLVVFSIFKNEASYLKEWIEYHRIVGVEHFYLYNNSSTDNYAEELKYYIDNDIVTLIDWPGDPYKDGIDYQATSRQHFIDNFKKDSVWGANIDLDEFIVPTEGATIPEVIEKILDRAKKKFSVLRFPFEISGICLSWLYYGTSFHKIKPEGLVLENYLNRIDEKDNDNWCKCIYLLDNIDHIDNPHFTIQKGYLMVDEDGDIVQVMGRMCSTKCKFIRVNHYTTKSESEHENKLDKRGFADGLRISKEHRDLLINQGRYQFNKVFDPITLRYVPAIKNRIKEITNT